MSDPEPYCCECGVRAHQVTLRDVFGCVLCENCALRPRSEAQMPADWLDWLSEDEFSKPRLAPHAGTRRRE